jgi:hypothetical protein
LFKNSLTKQKFGVFVLRLRVFQNGVLTRIFECKRDEVTREWRKLHNEGINDMYSSRNIIRVIKSRTMKWVGHVSRMWRGEVYTMFWGKPWGKENTWEIQA